MDIVYDDKLLSDMINEIKNFNLDVGKKFKIDDKLYFIIYDYDVRYFYKGKYVMEFNTYPIKPYKLGPLLFQIIIRV